MHSCTVQSFPFLKHLSIPKIPSLLLWNWCLGHFSGNEETVLSETEFFHGRGWVACRVPEEPISWSAGTTLPHIILPLLNYYTKCLWSLWSFFFFLHVFPVERINLGMCFQRRFGAVNPWKCFPQDTSRFIAGIHDGIPRTLWELVLVGFPFWGSYGVWGNGYGLGTHQRLGKWVLNLTIQISQPRTEALSSPHQGLSGLSLAFSFSKPF